MAGIAKSFGNVMLSMVGWSEADDEPPEPVGDQCTPRRQERSIAADGPARKRWRNQHGVSPGLNVIPDICEERVASAPNLDEAFQIAADDHAAFVKAGQQSLQKRADGASTASSPALVPKRINLRPGRHIAAQSGAERNHGHTTVFDRHTRAYPPEPSHPSPAKPKPTSSSNVERDNPPEEDMEDPKKVEDGKANEPNYVKKDAEIRDEIWLLMTEIQEFARSWFQVNGRNGKAKCLAPGEREELFRQLCQEASDQFITNVGRIAVGGPKADDSWKELFFGNEERQALVCGIIGNALVEQVFAHMFFGGTEEQRREVEQVQLKSVLSDGFVRTARYAKTIGGFLKEGQLPSNFESHAIEITGGLRAHLQPILPIVGYSVDPHHKNLTDPKMEYAMVSGLFQIVAHAGIISVLMRQEGDAVYYWVPTLKDDRYDSDTMECFNWQTMLHSNPKGEKFQRLKGKSDAEKRREKGDIGLVRVNCMNGCTVYRRGGWVDQPEYKDMGIRSRNLTQNWVLCRWGRQRQWTRGEKSDVPAVHGSENWKELGFMEFREVAENMYDRKKNT